MDECFFLKDTSSSRDLWLRINWVSLEEIHISFFYWQEVNLTGKCHILWEKANKNQIQSQPTYQIPIIIKISTHPPIKSLHFDDDVKLEVTRGTEQEHRFPMLIILAHRGAHLIYNQFNQFVKWGAHLIYNNKHLMSSNVKFSQIPDIQQTPQSSVPFAWTRGSWGIFPEIHVYCIELMESQKHSIRLFTWYFGRYMLTMSAPYIA